MSRAEQQLLADIAAAASAIADHLVRGDLDDGLVFDAVRLRLIEIGEAVKGLSPGLLGREPGVPWQQVARMRDWLAHRYFDTSHAVVRQTVDVELPVLLEAVARLRNLPS